MKFLYKVWSNYDGFTPDQVAARLLPGGLLRLGWTRYIESVEDDSEIWVYFHGRHAFENGVYVKGVVHAVDFDAGEVLLRVRQAATEAPLTDAAATEHIARIAAARGLQVFVLPEVLDAVPACDVGTSAETCSRRQCGGCSTWGALPLICARNLGAPPRLPDELIDFVPAYWVVAPRNFIHLNGQRIKTSHHRTDELFRRFKTGEERLAFPLALGIREALADRGLLQGFDAVIPVPLSPEKQAAGEIHRTQLLATELARLIGSPVRNALSLFNPISKRRLRFQQGLGAARFEAAYRRELVVAPEVHGLQRVALLDDVCTEGSTLRSSFAALRAVNPAVEVVAVTAGQMTVRASVQHEEDLIA